MRNDDDQHMAEPDSAGTPESLLSNLVVGLGAMVGGVVVIFFSLPMPTLGTGRPGPGLFPGMIGGLAALFGLVLVTTSLIKARQAATITAETGPSASSPDEPNSAPTGQTSVQGGGNTMVDLDLGANRRWRWTNVFVVLGAILFYVLAAETLGFIITMFVVLLVIMLALGSRRLFAVIIAAGATAALYAVFEQVLLVQLPDGPLI